MPPIQHGAESRFAIATCATGRLEGFTVMRVQRNTLLLLASPFGIMFAAANFQRAIFGQPPIPTCDRQHMVESLPNGTLATREDEATRCAPGSGLRYSSCTEFLRRS